MLQKIRFVIIAILSALVAFLAVNVCPMLTLLAVALELFALYKVIK
jgi:hypothetical protein